MGPLTPEFVAVQRTGGSLPAYIDPENRRLFLWPGADIIAGDIAGFRGYVRRIIELPFLYDGGGVVAKFEDGPPYFPDLGTIQREGTWALDENTGDRVYTAGTTVYSGPCHVANDPYAFDRRSDVGAQMVSTVAFVIQVPLAVTDMQDGDIFTVTTSRDPRLLTRVFTIKSVRAHSDNLFREALAFDNQGD